MARRTREERNPETATFMYYNANPKNRITCDCVIRAICAALDEDYNTVLKEMIDMQIKTGYMINSKECFGKYLESKGWEKHQQPRQYDNTKYTGSEFCKLLSFENKNGEIGNVVCNIGGNHTVVIKPTFHGIGAENSRYKVIDTWNSTDGCIGNYWTKKRGN